MNPGVGWDFGTTIASPVVPAKGDHPQAEELQSPTKQPTQPATPPIDTTAQTQPAVETLVADEAVTAGDLMEVDPTEGLSSEPSQDGDGVFEWPASMANQPDSPQKKEPTSAIDPAPGNLDEPATDDDPHSSPAPAEPAPAPALPTAPVREQLILEEATPPGSTHPSDDGNDLFTLDDNLLATEPAADAPASSQLEEGEIREPVAVVAEATAEAGTVVPPEEGEVVNGQVEEVSSSPSVEEDAPAAEDDAEDDLEAEPATHEEQPELEPEPIEAQPPTPSPKLAPEVEPVQPVEASSEQVEEMEVDQEGDMSLLTAQIEQSLPPPSDLPLADPPRSPLPDTASTSPTASPAPAPAPASATALDVDTEPTARDDLAQLPAARAEDSVLPEPAKAAQPTVDSQDPKTSSFLGVFIPPRPAHIPSARSIRMKAEEKKAKAEGKTKPKGKGKAKAKAVKLDSSDDEKPVVKRKRGRPPKNPKEDKKTIGMSRKRSRAETSSEDERPAKKSARGSSPSKEKAKEKARKEEEREKAEREKRRRRKEKKRRMKDEDESEDEDDLELSGKETVQKSKLRPKKELTKAEKALRRMREQRNAKNGEPSSSRRVVDISDDDDQRSNGQSPKLAKKHVPHYAGASGSSSSGSSDDDDYSSSSESSIENFIIDESDDDDEAKELLEEAREKARAKKQGVNFHVKPFIQWLVYLAVNPEVDWLAKDESFGTAQKEVERFVKSQAHSLISSQVWTAAFRRAVDTRPTWNAAELRLKKGEVAPRCDACTLGKHKTASMVGTLSGGRYDRKTFKRIEPDSDEDSDESDASDEDDGKDRVFNMAGNCLTKTNATNQILHWPYHTYKRVRFFVKKHKTELPHVPDASLLPADQARKVRKVEREMLANEADRLATMMDAEGRISKMAREFRELVTEVRGTFAS